MSDHTVSFGFVAARMKNKCSPEFGPFLKIGRIVATKKPLRFGVARNRLELAAGNWATVGLAEDAG
jgi:hypothetical protein